MLAFDIRLDLERNSLEVSWEIGFMFLAQGPGDAILIMKCFRIHFFRSLEGDFGRAHLDAKGVG